MQTKTIRSLLLLFLFTTGICEGQEFNQPGWFHSSRTLQTELPSKVITVVQPQSQTLSMMSLVTTPEFAEAQTEQIRALARGLENNPVKIFEYVRDHIRYVHYFGSKKGAQLTLLERSGNDFDQSALLVSLLRAAGFSANYKFGTVFMPYEQSNHRDLKHWLGVTKPNTNWQESSYFISGLNETRGFPFTGTIYNDQNDIVFHHIWVELTWQNTVYPLDPSFKVYERIAGLDLAKAMGLDTNAIMNAAGGTSTNGYAQNLNEATLRDKLRDYSTNLIAYVRSNVPNASVQEILGGQYLSSGQAFNQSLPFTPCMWDTNSPNLTWQNIPTNFMSSVRITVDVSTNCFIYMPQLQGQRLSLTFSTNGLAELWLDDDPLLQKQTSGGATIDVIIASEHPHGDWDWTNNTLINGTKNDHSATASYQRTNSSYAIVYAFEPEEEWLLERQRKLDAYRSQGFADTSRQVTTETLNVMGLSWMLQTDRLRRTLGDPENILIQNHHRFGRMAQEFGKGYYVDVYEQLNDDRPASGDSADDYSRWLRVFDTANYFFSAAEHALIEQTQSSNLVAASTVKMLQIANTNAQRVYQANSSNWAAIAPNLSNYDKTQLKNDYIDQGYTLLLPANGSNFVAGASSWAGYGIIARGNNAGYYTMAMLISGGYYGGYTSDSDVSVDTPWIVEYGTSQPSYFDSVSSLLFNPLSFDPVSMADGSFELSSTDLSLGQVEPKGISFTRSYSSSRRQHNLTGMGNGWMHNFYIKATDVSSPLASLGDTTPAQMAPLIVATKAALAIYDPDGNAKNWVISALIAKWGLDQTINNAVSISLGNDTIQFIKQPDGSYTPPAASTMSLMKSRGEYFLKERNGRTFQFGPNGYLLYLFDQYNQTLHVTYNSSNWVQTVTDWKNRQLTFNYSGSPLRLTSINDNSSPSRMVAFGYQTNGTGLDLTSVIDVENQTNRMVYDTNHQLIASIDAYNQMVVSNVYDGFGRVTDQFTKGDTNQHWQLYWSGFLNVQKDPSGGVTQYGFDEKHRFFRLVDPLGRESNTFYDGQDHTIKNISPSGASESYVYDANHNLLQHIDALGYTNQFIYDSQNQLIQSIDPLLHTNYFGWNAKHSLEATTNAIGNWVHTIYNSDGTISNKTDVAGVTTYSYDQYGQVNSISYPTIPSTSEGYLNSSMGDVLSHTNARLFVTSFQYNARRQLTNSTAPTNLVLKTIYDRVGNVAVAIDPKGQAKTNFWSPTRKLLGMVYPAALAGSRQITNIYDSRDWLQRTSSETNRWTVFFNDPAQQLLQTIDPLFRTNLFGYDADGRRVASTNAAFQTNGYIFNVRGELVKSIDAGTHSVLHQFDAVGNEIRLTNRNGKVWQFQYDAANRLTNTTSPLLRSTTNGWNSRGLLASTREPSGQRATFLYDAMKRLTNRSDAVSTLTYDHDANGNQLKVSEGSRNLNWTYDAYDRISTYTDADGNLLKYYYDQNGNLTNLVYPDNRSVSYFYDNLNQLTNVTDWAQRKTLMAYDLAGRLTNIIRFNGTVRDIQYDAAGQATNIVERTISGVPIAYQKLHWNNAARMDWEFMAPMPHPYTQPGRTNTVDDDNRIATFNGQSVIHDLDGNMTSGPLLDNSFVSYGYNARNQLTSMVSVASISSAIFATNGSSTYNTWGTAQNGYGPVNLKTQAGPLVTGVKLNGPLRNNYEGWVGFKFVVGPGGMKVTQLGRWVTAGNNQSHTVKLVSASGTDISGGSVTVNTFGAPAGQFAYGTLASPLTLSANTIYFVVTREYLNGDQWWDYTSQLSGPGTWTFNYDPAGNRVAMTNGTLVTKFVVNPNVPLSQKLVRTKPDGSKTFYLYGPGLLYEVNETSGGIETSTQTYHYDSRGSTIALTDGSGYVTDRIEYSAYGTITYRAGNTDTPFLFNGRYGVQTDPSGLLYMRARYYNPYLCRFINADPSGFSGGLNFYAFADGNPITLMDPFGLAAGDLWFDRWGNSVAEWTETAQDYYNNNLPWLVAGTLNTGISFVSGTLRTPQAIGHLGEGSGTFSVNPTLENAAGLLNDIAIVTGTTAAGFAPLPSANVPLGYGDVVYRYVGAGEADVARGNVIPNINAKGEPKPVYVTPDNPMSSATQAESSLQIGAQNPGGPTPTPTHIIAGDASGIDFSYKGQVSGGTGTEWITTQEIPVISVNRIGYNLQYGTAVGGLGPVYSSIITHYK